ncbi:hypothetical protein VIH_000576 [Vibrio cholerae CT 5369-93]|nr:hypothetical protein VIH_000576 [Vibrio cholerae CT 5369-93]
MIWNIGQDRHLILRSKIYTKSLLHSNHELAILQWSHLFVVTALEL